MGKVPREKELKDMMTVVTQAKMVTSRQLVNQLNLAIATTQWALDDAEPGSLYYRRRERTLRSLRHARNGAEDVRRRLGDLTLNDRWGIGTVDRQKGGGNE